MSIIDNLITGGADGVDCGWGRPPEVTQFCMVHQNEPKGCPMREKYCGEECEYDKENETE